MFVSCIDSDISNDADNNSPFSCNKDIKYVIGQLTMDSKSLLQWFAKSGFKAKFHLIISTFNVNNFLRIQQYKIYNTMGEKLLGNKIDNLSFDEHIAHLVRITHFML